MCLGLNYEFSVLLVPRELQKSYPGIEIDSKFINQLLIDRCSLLLGAIICLLPNNKPFNWSILILPCHTQNQGTNLSKEFTK